MESLERIGFNVLSLRWYVLGVDQWSVGKVLPALKVFYRRGRFKIHLQSITLHPLARDVCLAVTYAVHGHATLKLRPGWHAEGEGEIHGVVRFYFKGNAVLVRVIRALV